MNALESIPVGVGSSYVPVYSARYSFIAGIGAFVVIFFSCRVNGSNWGVGSARKALSALRTLIFLELICLAILLYFYVAIGTPISYHSALKFANGQNWIYGYPRPVAGILFISCGMFADMHPVMRHLSFLGAIVQVLGDTISSFQIYDYKNQVARQNAPSHGYSLHSLTVYFWRDLVSIGLCTTIVFLLVYLVAMLGFTLPQLIHPSAISGDFYDRFDVMHRGRSKRKFMESSEIITSPPQFNLKERSSGLRDQISKNAHQSVNNV